MMQWLWVDLVRIIAGEDAGRRPACALTCGRGQPATMAADAGITLISCLLEDRVHKRSNVGGTTGNYQHHTDEQQHQDKWNEKPTIFLPKMFNKLTYGSKAHGFITSRSSINIASIGRARRNESTSVSLDAIGSPAALRLVLSSTGC